MNKVTQKTSQEQEPKAIFCKPCQVTSENSQEMTFERFATKEPNEVVFWVNTNVRSFHWWEGESRAITERVPLMSLQELTGKTLIIHFKTPNREFYRLGILQKDRDKFWLKTHYSGDFGFSPEPEIVKEVFLVKSATMVL